MPITLSAKGSRNVVTAAEAEKILNGWKELLNTSEDKTVVEIDLSCRTWKSEVLAVFETFFTEAVAPSVEILKIDDVIASLDTEDGLDSLSFFSRIFADSPIVSVNLNDNAIGTRGLERLQSLLKGEKLERLYFHNCGMSKEVAEDLTRILAPRASRLRSLDLGRNQIGSEGAEEVSKLISACTSMESFEYAGSRPLKQGTSALCNGLVEMTKTNKVLQVLDLDDCLFGTGEEEDDPVHLLVQAITASPSLKKLVLKDGALEFDGLVAVIDALKASGAKLSYLDLGALYFENEGAEALVEFIKDSQLGSLVELHLEANSLANDGALTVLSSLTESKLQVLNLSDNEIEEEGYQAILDNPIPSLKKLLLKENDDEIEEDMIEQLRKLYPSVVIGEDEEEQKAQASSAATANASLDDLTEALQEAKI